MEDNYTLCVPIKEPLCDGHIIILPKRHVETFDKLNPKEACSIFKMLEKISAALQKTFNKNSCINWINQGTAKSQDHLHIHMLPSEMSVRSAFASYMNTHRRRKESPGKLKKISEKIKKSSFSNSYSV